HITPVTNTAMDHVDEGRLVLTDGKTINFGYAMIVPPFLGQQVITDAAEVADPNGYVKVRDTYQTLTRNEVYAVGIAVAVDVPWQTPTPVGVPKTGFPDGTPQDDHVSDRETYCGTWPIEPDQGCGLAVAVSVRPSWRSTRRTGSALSGRPR